MRFIDEVCCASEDQTIYLRLTDCSRRRSLSWNVRRCFRPGPRSAAAPSFSTHAGPSAGATTTPARQSDVPFGSAAAVYPFPRRQPDPERATEATGGPDHQAIFGTRIGLQAGARQLHLQADLLHPND